MIITNKAKCLKCNEILESKNRYDYVSCSCGNLSVDGGKDYIKRGFMDHSLIEEMSEIKKESNIEKCIKFCKSLETHDIDYLQNAISNLAILKEEKVDYAKLEGCPNNYGLDDSVEFCAENTGLDICFRCWKDALK